MKTRERDRRAFSAATGIVIVVVVILVAAGAIYLAMPKPSSSSTTSSSMTSSNSASPTSSSSTESSSSSSSTSTSSTSSSSSSTTSSNSTSSSGATVTIPQGAGGPQELNFTPANLTVTAGTTITFSDQDSSATHDVHFLTGPSGATLPQVSPNLTKGDTFTVTLTVPGTYTYVCDYHSWMKGTIVVTASGTSATTESG